MAKRRRRANVSFGRGGMSIGTVAKQLKEVFGDTVVAAAKEALKNGAEMVAKDAKARCPVYAGTKTKDGYVYMDKRVKPGELRDSIKAEPNKDGTVYQITANAKSESGFLYGQIVEFSPKINKPFLYPAMDANRLAVRNAIKDAIRAAVRGG